LGLGSLLSSLGQVTVSHYSFETIELFKEVMSRVSRERADSREIATYIIELHFRQLANESDRRFFNSVPTSLQLPAKTVDRLCELARRNLAENRKFKRLVADLKRAPIKLKSPARQSIA